MFACLLYVAGLSYRAMTFQTGGMVDASHVSVYNWVHGLRTLTSRVPRKERGVHSGGRVEAESQQIETLFVWSAIDTETKELLAVYASYQRSSLNTVWFMRRGVCSPDLAPTGRWSLVDGGPVVPVGPRQARPTPGST